MISSITVLKREDSLLAELVKQDDEKAFKELYDRYHKLLYIVACRFLKSEDLSKELVQDVFMKVWLNRKNLNSNLNFKAYIFKIAKNTILNTLKRAAKEASIKQQIIYSASTCNNETDDSISYAEAERIKEDAVNQLPPQRQIVYKLCKEDGKSYEEVAEILNISKGTVKDHMVKALKSIKQHFSAYSDVHITLFFLILPYIKK